MKQFLERITRSADERRRDAYLEAHPPAEPARVLTACGVDVPDLVWLGEAPGGPIRAFWAEDRFGWWLTLRDLHRRTGLWPVLHDPDLGELFAALPGEGWEESYDADAVLRAGDELTPEQVLEDLHRRRVADDSPAARGGDRPQDLPEHLDEPEPTDAFSLAVGAGWVILVPARHSWEAIAVLGWRGGDVDGLDPVHHLVLQRDWHRRFGAELVGLDVDGMMELRVPNPPRDRQEARVLAWELATYCPDLLEGTDEWTEPSGYARIAEDTACMVWWFIWRWSH